MKTETALFKLDAGLLARKAELEKIISEGVRTFIAVGEALAEVRNRKLYADEFETFDDYMTLKWNIGKSQGYRLMDAASVARNVSPMGEVSKIIPTERVARELARVEPKEQKKAARVLARVSKERRVTASVARSAVSVVRSMPRGGLAAMAAAVQSEPQTEIQLNEKPKMTPIAKAQAQATIQEWYTANSRRLNEHPAASPETVVRRIIALFT